MKASLEDLLPTLFVTFRLLVLYWFPLRRWMNQWGATSSDMACVMAGDILPARMAKK
jgi:hypothetical protein